MNGLKAATSTTNPVDVSNRTSISDCRNPLKSMCGQVVANMSQSKSATIEIALARNDFSPIRTAGNASRNDNAPHIGALKTVINPARVTRAATKTAGIQSPM